MIFPIGTLVLDPSGSSFRIIDRHRSGDAYRVIKLHLPGGTPDPLHYVLSKEFVEEFGVYKREIVDGKAVVKIDPFVKIGAYDLKDYWRDRKGKSEVANSTSIRTKPAITS